MASPSCHDPARAPTTASRATLVGHSGDAVAFLDAPGIGAHELLDAVDDVLATMSDGAILTVFSDDPSASQMAAEWSADRRVELIAVIPHVDRPGTTLTFRRAEPGSRSDAPP
jgi:TusA-related sulfurtransferase